MVICRVGVVLYAGGVGKKWVVVENFSTGDKTPYRASGFFLYHHTSSIRRHGRHPKKTTFTLTTGIDK